MTLLYDLILDNKIKTLKLLLKNKVINSYTTTESGDTLTHLAAKYGDKKILKFLIRYNSETLRIKNKNGNTPLYLALIYKKYDNVKIILSYDFITLFIPNNNNKTPLSIGGNNLYKIIKEIYNLSL